MYSLLHNQELMELPDFIRKSFVIKFFVPHAWNNLNFQLVHGMNNYFYLHEQNSEEEKNTLCIYASSKELASSTVSNRYMILVIIQYRSI